ncbi:TPA: hypothetical protein ACXPK9_004465, partial [Salmonella enterica]
FDKLNGGLIFVIKPSQIIHIYRYQILLKLLSKNAHVRWCLVDFSNHNCRYYLAVRDGGLVGELREN